MSVRSDSLARVITDLLEQTEPGHCARVDFLDRATAQEVCRALRGGATADKLDAFVLDSSAGNATDEFGITADRAIELRNRKSRRLCIFVPGDVVGPTASSLANSFAELDGRYLQRRVLNTFKDQLPNAIRQSCTRVMTQLEDATLVSDEWRLDFLIAAEARVRAADERIGLELWRVGLVADAGQDYSDRLDQNRRAVLALTKPAKAESTAPERVRTLRLDAGTTKQLLSFFADRPLQDVRAWSKQLADGGAPTFDRWVPLGHEQSDLRSIVIRPFVDKRGVVLSYTKLSQEDPGGPLFAVPDARAAVVVKWDTQPPAAADVGRWRVELVPSSARESDATVDLPSAEVAGAKRTARVKLDQLQPDELPEFGIRVRLTAIDAAGNDIRLAAESESIELSDEFFLTNQPILGTENLRESHRQTPSIAFGRIEVAATGSATTIEESQPQWIGEEHEYFTIRLNERRQLTIASSPLLVDLERRALGDPSSYGRLVLAVPEITEAAAEQVEQVRGRTESAESWAAFLRARESFFSRVRAGKPRDTLESIEWNSDQSAHALRYANAYVDLLDRLERGDDLLDALSVDTVLIRLPGGAPGRIEEAALVLPTHPARVAWLAGYGQLLGLWEQQLLAAPRGRSKMIELAAVRTLAPANIPALSFHPDAGQPFLFFANLCFSFAVAIPVGATDPNRRFADVATILGVPQRDAVVSDPRPALLARQLSRYRSSHPYVRTLRTVLLNPDQGELFADALLPQFQSAQDGEEAATLPRIAIDAYVDDIQRSSLPGIGRLREARGDSAQTLPTDSLHPAVATYVRPLAQAVAGQIENAHLAVAADFTQPVLAPSPDDAHGNLSLFGLIARFLPTPLSESGTIGWRHELSVGPGASTPHPAGSRYSSALNSMHLALLRSSGLQLFGRKDALPAIEVRLTDADLALIDRLHARADWVVTLDRHLGIDFFDSPYVPRDIRNRQRYLIDYAPELSDGQGHRVMVTTAWRHEIGTILERAMRELGFEAVESSVGRLLHYLKTVSGRLVFDSLGTSTSATGAATLGLVTAWLQQRGRLRQSVLIPVDAHPRLFSPSSTPSSLGDRRCDLVLISLRRGIVEATFVEVKWRRGAMAIAAMAGDMVMQMHASSEAMNNRFFNADRVDGPLQRAHLANVLAFYLERARRYELLDEGVATQFLEHVARLERTGLQFRPSYEGYVVSLADPPQKPLVLDDARITVLTAADFEGSTEFVPSTDERNTRHDVSVAVVNTVGVAPTPAEPPRSAGAVEVAPDKDEDSLSAHPLSPATHAGRDAGVSAADSAVAVVLGRAAGGDVIWNPKVQGSPHMFISGIPGQGKSWTMTHLLVSLAEQGVASLVFDFHGQFSQSVPDLARPVLPTVLDASHGLPFSPFECDLTSTSDWQANVYALAEIFGYVAGLGDIQRDVVYTAIRDSYRDRGFSDLGPGDDLPDMQDVLAKIEASEQSRHVANVAARCRPLLEMSLFKPTVNSDLITSIRKGLIVDFSKLHVDAVQVGAAAFLLRKTYRDMLRWGEADRLRLAILVDEAHRLSKDSTLPKIMKEGRKFGVAVVVASQGVGDFHADVLGNAGTKVLFRTNYPESRKVAAFVRGREGADLAAKLEQLQVGQAYVQTPEMPLVSLVSMLPPNSGN